MPKIVNLSMSDVVQGRFPDWCDKDTILIQIQDTDNSPTAKFANVKKRGRFVSCVQMRFDDIDKPDPGYFTVISDDQAKQLADVIKHAKLNDLNIAVHCHAGLCRSGAVVEAAVRYGFDDPKKTRMPNTLVLKKISHNLGIGKQDDYYDGIF